MTLTLANGSVLLGGRFVPANLVIEGPSIAAIGAGLVPRGEVVDCRGLNIVPGLIDLQVYGGGGRMFSANVDETSFETVARAHASTGTTALCPTIMSGPPNDMIAAVTLAASLCERDVPGGAAFVGIHVVGPFLSDDQRGVHRSTHIQRPSMDFARQLVAAARGWLRIVTLAPEVEGALPVIEYLAAEGVHVAAGHTSADSEAMYAAMSHGLTGVTQLLNNMAPFAARAPGPAGVVMGSSLYASVAGDLLHVNRDALRVVLGARPAGHTYLTSNAVAPLGSDMRTFDLHGESVTVREGGCYTQAGDLVGTAVPLSRMVRNLIRDLETTVEVAVAMATSVPARILGLRTRGDIRPGGTADLLVIERYKVSSVILRGTIIEAWPNYHRL